MPEVLNRLLNNRKIKIAIILILAAAAVISVLQGLRNANTFSQDFQWDAAKALSMRINPYDESLNPTGALDAGELGDFYSRFEEINAPQKMEANQFPSLLMLLLPMTLLSPDAARVAWIILNLVFTAGIIWLLRQTFLKDTDDFTFAVLMLLMLAGTPYRNQLGVGQHTLFAFAFFMLAVWFSDVKKQPVGTTLALFVSYFKYTLTAPLVIYFIYRKKYKEIAISILMHAALTVVSAVWLKDSVINMIIKPLKVASVLKSEGGIDLGAVFGGLAISFVIAALIAVLLVMMAVMAPEGCGGLIFAAGLLWSLVLTYHRTYDFFVLSAAGCVLTDFATGSGLLKLYGKDDKRLPALIVYLYAAVLFTSFFVLRLFSENLGSRIVLGVLYYGLTIAVTYVLCEIVKEKIKA